MLRRFICCVILIVAIHASAMNLYRDSIISDFDSLVKIIEDTHPDPYTNFGGRVFFHIKAKEYRQSLIEDSCLTIDDLYDKSSEFISLLQDGHSYIDHPSTNISTIGNDSLLLVKFMYGGDSLIVNAIDKDHRHLLGSRVIGINGVGIETIVGNVAKYIPCENKAGRYGFLSDYFRQVGIYRKLAETPGQEISLQLLTPEGKSATFIPYKINAGDFGKSELSRVPESDGFPSKQMEWRDVDGTMMFRLSTVQSRENFDFQYRNGWDFYQQLQYYYRMAGEVMPADTVSAIEAVPSLSETFMEMLQTMKLKNIKNLVIDLRGNGGGWTPITLPTLFMMYGDDYLDRDMSNQFYRRISALYLKKINCNIDEFNSQNSVNLKEGDYLIPIEVEDSRSKEQKREDFIKSAFCSDEIKCKLRSLNGVPIYRPEKVFVVTDNATFSAAFHYAFYLSKMGAVVAGETSSQAPNCYMEVTPFTLPHTGLSGSISNSLQMFVPVNDTRSREFTPDIRLTYDDYRRYNFDQNSILLHILNK